ncbi:MAG: ABC transporter permease [Bryobacterales bacterium]|nr:ABC transporter permease [Bryobacterales bacterium]
MSLGKWVEQAWRDAQYAVRGFQRNPAFALTGIIAIALGVGAATAVFSVVDRVLFRSLPYPGDERLVSVGLAAPIEEQEFMLGSDYVEWRARQTAFESITTWSGIADCDLTDQNPIRLSCAQVEGTFLSTLGIRPLLGREFHADEDRPGGPRVAIISYGLWQSRFQKDPSITGKTIPLDGRPAEIVGVLPAEFEFPTLAKADLLVPQALDEAAQRRPRTGRVMRAVARLKPGINVSQALARMDPLFLESLNFVPPQFRKEVRLRIRPLRDRQIADSRTASLVLLCAVGGVLLIACANAANLLLARAVGRRREMAVRAALGAGKARMVRQGLTESLALSLPGGAAGCVLAWLLLRVLVAAAPEGIPRLQQANLDWRVLVAALAASFIAGGLSGIAPALMTPHAGSLRTHQMAAAGSNLFKHALVTFQVAASLVLLTGSVLLVRSFWKMLNTPLGLQRENLLSAAISLGEARYGTPRRQLAFFEELEERLKRVPGFTSVALSDSLPPGGQTRAMLYAAIDVRERPRFAQGTGGMVVWRSVTPEYFTTLAIPVIKGRAFDDSDRAKDAAVMIMSQSLAERMFPNEDPIGKAVQPGRSGPWLTVAGVAANVKNGGLGGAADPEYYVPRRHSETDALRRSIFIVKTSADPERAAAAIRREAALIDPGLPVILETMSQRVAKLAARPRFNALLLSLFALIGLLLAAVGLHGVVAFLFAQRTQEIGVRMALGATGWGIRRLVLKHALRWTITGVAAGAVASLWFGRFLRTLLFQVPANDPLMIALAACILVGAGLLAAWVPARRAARLDPLTALRTE